jgi:hypothetical protein
MPMLRVLLLVSFAFWYSASHAASSLYRCEAKDAVSLGSDGRIERGVATAYWQQQYANFIVDTATGAIRFGSAKPDQWLVVQQGGPANDFVAVPNVAGGQRLVAAAATDFIRVRAWSEMKGKVLFIKYQLSQMITGTCDPIQ